LNSDYLTIEQREALLRDWMKRSRSIKYINLKQHLVDHAFANIDNLPSEYLILVMQVLKPEKRAELMKLWMNKPKTLKTLNA